jgi:hypothetical protein
MHPKGITGSQMGLPAAKRDHRQRKETQAAKRDHRQKRGITGSEDGSQAAKMDHRQPKRDQRQPNRIKGSQRE